jgi:phytol kinase
VFGDPALRRKMVIEIPFAALVVGSVMAGLWISNTLYDLKVPQYISRKIGHSAGGLAFLMSGLLFSSAWWPIILSASFGLVLWIARIARPRTFRGVGGSGRNPNVMAEVWFAWIAVPVFAVGWLWLDQPLITISCLLFMAWGDCVSGLVRAQVYGRPVKGLWGSAAMFIVCMGISWAFIQPFWIGAIGSLIATFTEWSFGDVGQVKWADDNWAIPAISLATIMGIMAVTGYI